MHVSRSMMGMACTALGRGRKIPSKARVFFFDNWLIPHCFYLPDLSFGDV